MVALFVLLLALKVVGTGDRAIPLFVLTVLAVVVDYTTWRALPWDPVAPRESAPTHPEGQTAQQPEDGPE